MENRLSKYTVSFGLSFVIASVVNALLVVARKKSPAVQGWMQRTTGHHWVTHIAIVLILFVVLGFLFSNLTIPVNRLIRMIVGGVLVSGLIIVGFYLMAG